MAPLILGNKCNYWQQLKATKACIQVLLEPFYRYLSKCAILRVYYNIMPNLSYSKDDLDYHLMVSDYNFSTYPDKIQKGFKRVESD